MYVRIISIEYSWPRKWKVVINSSASNFELHILLSPSLFHNSWANSELVAKVNIGTNFYLEPQVNHSSWLNILNPSISLGNTFKVLPGKEGLFRGFRKIAKKEKKRQFLHAHLSTWNKSAPTGPIFRKIWYLRIFSKIYPEIFNFD